MNQDPRVQSSIMFGRGRFQAGIIVDPRPEYAIDPDNEEQLSEFRNAIWWADLLSVGSMIVLSILYQAHC
jgi:hypothetical protein